MSSSVGILHHATSVIYAPYQCAAVLAVAAVFHVHSADAQRVPIRAGVDGRPALEVIANDHRLLLGIETGSIDAVLIDRGLADDLNLPQISPSVGPLRRIRRIQIGDFVKDDVVVFTDFSFRLLDLDGLIGLDFFRDITLTLDFVHSEILLLRDTVPSINGGDILELHPAGPANQLFAIRGRIADRTIPMLIDTQADVEVMCPPEIASQMEFEGTPADFGRLVIGGTVVDGSVARSLEDLEFGHFVVRQPVVTIIDPPAHIGDIGGCIIGFGILKHFAVALDQRSRRIDFLHSPRNLPRSAAIYSIGVSAQADADAVRVTWISPDVAHAAEGITVGAEIVAVNNVTTPGDVIRELHHNTARYPKPELQIRMKRESRIVDLILPWKVVVP